MRIELRATAVVVAAIASGGAAGCSDSHKGADPAAEDAASEDATADARELPFDGGADELTVVTVGGEISEDDPTMAMDAEPADYSCLGSRTAPAGGDVILAELRLTEILAWGDMEAGGSASDVCLRWHLDDVVAPSEPCDGDRTDGDGVIDVNAPSGGWIAVRTFRKSGSTAAESFLDTVQRHVFVPETAERDMVSYTVSEQTANLLVTSVLGFLRREGSTLLLGRIRDCGDRDVFGILIRVVRSDGSYITEETTDDGTRYRYYDGADFPSRSQPWTHVDGHYIAVNLPVNEPGEQVFVEAWGRLEEGGPVRLLGCETTRLYPDGAAVADIGPVRADGPRCPGLRR